VLIRHAIENRPCSNTIHRLEIQAAEDKTKIRSWTDTEIAGHLRNVGPSGHEGAGLGFALMLYTGQRREPTLPSHDLGADVNAGTISSCAAKDRTQSSRFRLPSRPCSWFLAAAGAQPCDDHQHRNMANHSRLTVFSQWIRDADPRPPGSRSIVQPHGLRQGRWARRLAEAGLYRRHEG